MGTTSFAPHELHHPCSAHISRLFRDAARLRSAQARHSFLPFTALRLWHRLQLPAFSLLIRRLRWYSRLCLEQAAQLRLPASRLRERQTVQRASRSLFFTAAVQSLTGMMMCS